MQTTMLRGFAFAILTALLGNLASCGNPYANSVTAIDFNPPQTKAAIQLTDPQIYSRETLLNDRRREVDYLDGLIKESASVQFEPQLKRVLQSVEALQADLKGSIDPTLGKQNQRAEQLADIQQQVDLSMKNTQLAIAQTQLAQAQNQLKAIQAASAADSTNNSSSNAPGQSTPAAQADASADKLKEMQAKLDAANAAINGNKADIKSLQDQLKDKLPDDLKSRLPDASPTRGANITPSPLELYRDRQAYRDELRAAQSREQLDDGHELDAHGLYRLQFGATVLPGKTKNKYAVARATVVPRPLRDQQIISLYKLWLAHASYRLNGIGIADGNSRPSGPDSTYLSLAADRKLLSYVSLPLGSISQPGLEHSNANNFSLRLAVPPKLRKFANEFISKSGSLDTYISSRSQTINEFETAKSTLNRSIEALSAAVRSANASSNVKLPEVGNPDNFQEFLRTPATRSEAEAIATNSSRVNQATANVNALQACDVYNEDFLKRTTLSFLSDSIRGLGHWDTLDAPQRAVLDGFLDKIATAQNVAQEDVAPTAEATSAQATQKVQQCQLAELALVPTEFNEVVRPPLNTHGASSSYAYATTPLELVQQVSTVSSAIKSVQLGMALSAAFPGSGANADASLKYLNAARGEAEALERMPLVVGFADRRDCQEVKIDVIGSSCAQFGWIFGPHAALDPEKKSITLEQGVRNYPVTVDLALPSWWPEVELKLETAWISSWDNAGDVLQHGKDDQVATNIVERTLPHNRADMDNLTEALAFRSSGGALASSRAFRVEPAVITPCGGTTSLLVYGSNIWRSSEAYLNGVRAKEVRVLPDMAGLSLSFDTADLPKNSSGKSVNLIIWTRNGPTERSLTLNSGDECQSRRSSTASLHFPVQHVAGGDQSIRIVADGGLMGVPLAFRFKPSSISSDAAWTRVVLNGYQPVGDGKSFELNFPQLSGVSPFKNAEDGTAFDAQLEFTALTNMLGSVVSFDGRLVYYKTTPAIKAKSEQTGSAMLGSLGDPIIVEFPKGAEQAFSLPEIRNPTFSATIDGTPNKALVVSSQGRTAGGLPRVVVSLPAGSASEADLRKTADLKISLTVNGSDVPAPCNACLTLPKSP